MSNKIFYQFYNPTGMINQIMSLELAVGLAHETKKTLVVHYVSNNGDNLYNFRTVPIFTPSKWYNKNRENFTNPDQFPHLLDLVNFNQDLIFIDQKIDFFKQQEFMVEDMLSGYYYSKEDSISDDELQFAEGRQRLPLDKVLHIKKTLGWYSRFFYNRDNALDNVLGSVKFKPVYYELAKKISDSLGAFQGMHLRLSDHVRMFETTQGMFESWLNKFEQNSLPIVLSTCEPGHKMVEDNKHRVIMLDEYIVNNFRDEFMALPFQDEVVFGLICNLVLHDSINFVGTSGSTYTAYIHRVRHQRGIETWDFFDNPQKANGVPYSWNQYPLDLGRKMWWREWSESKLKQ